MDGRWKNNLRLLLGRGEFCTPGNIWVKAVEKKCGQDIQASRDFQPMLKREKNLLPLYSHEGQAIHIQGSPQSGFF